MSTNQKKHRDNVPAARELRTRQTKAEEVLWEGLRNRRLDGLKFRRQHPVGPFVLDFCCPDRRLAIELDGEVHDDQRDRDAEREALLTTLGYQVLRFSNDAVWDDLSAVLEAIHAAALSQPPRSPQPIPRTAGRE